MLYSVGEGTIGLLRLTEMTTSDLPKRAWSLGNQKVSNHGNIGPDLLLRSSVCCFLAHSWCWKWCTRKKKKKKKQRRKLVYSQWDWSELSWNWKTCICLLILVWTRINCAKMHSCTVPQSPHQAHCLIPSKHYKHQPPFKICILFWIACDVIWMKIKSYTILLRNQIKMYSWAAPQRCACAPEWKS